jgi:hypothetical protein
MTFAQLDALACAPDVTCDELSRYMLHAEFREHGPDDEHCMCGGDPAAMLFCYAPFHFRPWWAPQAPRQCHDMDGDAA